jgi:hypothetical protein
MLHPTELRLTLNVLCGTLKNTVPFASAKFIKHFSSLLCHIRVCYNCGLFYLLRNGLEWQSESLLLFLFHGTEFRVVFSYSEGFGTEFREFFVSRNSRNSVGNMRLFHLFCLPRNYIFLSVGLYLNFRHLLYSFLFLVVFSAGIIKQSMEARNRIGIGLSYRPARLGWRNRFLGSLKVCSQHDVGCTTFIGLYIKNIINSNLQNGQFFWS